MTNSKYQYAFNSMDQLTDVYKWTYSGGWSRSLAASYYYDANGARAKTVEGSRTTEHVYAGHDPICEKSGSAYTDYVYLNGRLKVKMIGSDSYWYVDDALGSTRLVYKGSVKVYSVTTYKPFGTAFGTSGTEKFTYAGEMLDSPTGLYYLFARYYDQSTGRFVSMDPKLGKLSAPQTLDRYTYCANNPINRVDPTGEFFNLIAAAFGAAVGAAVNGIIYGVECAAGLKEWDWGEFAGELAIGAATGAVIGLTMGLATALKAGEFGAKVAITGVKVAQFGEKLAMAGGKIAQIGSKVIDIGSKILKVGGKIVKLATEVSGKSAKLAKLGWSAISGGLGGTTDATLRGNDPAKGFVFGMAGGAVGGYFGLTSIATRLSAFEVASTVTGADIAEQILGELARKGFEAAS
jgi:RHS repeat-associated protein